MSDTDSEGQEPLDKVKGHSTLSQTEEISLIENIDTRTQLLINNEVVPSEDASNSNSDHTAYSVFVKKPETPQEIVNALSLKIARNDLGFPIGYYRVDMLNMHSDIDFSGDPQFDQALADTMRAAFVPLAYDEGYPILPSGLPWWMQLPHEPPETYHLFQIYLEQGMRKRNTPSSLSQPINEYIDKYIEVGRDEFEDPLESKSFVRQLQRVAKTFQSKMDIKVPLDTVKDAYTLYYWNERAKAHDLFNMVAAQKQLEARALDTMDMQYIVSTRMMSRLMEYMDDDDDFWDVLTPQVATNLLKNLSVMQRTAAGLNANGPSSGGGGSNSKGSGSDSELSVEFQFRKLAQRQMRDTIDAGHSASSTVEQQLSEALSDENTALIAQELIFRLNKTSHD